MLADGVIIENATDVTNHIARLRIPENAYIGKSLFFDEKATQETIVAGEGQVWVKDTSPTTLMFTDDDGDDHVVTLGASDLGEMGNVWGASATEEIFDADEWHAMFHANITGSAPHLNIGFSFVAGQEDDNTAVVRDQIVDGAGLGAGADSLTIWQDAHGLLTGDYITVQSANHDGVAEVVKIDADSIHVKITYVGDEACTWQEGSYLLVATPGQYRGIWNASFSQSDNAARTSIVTPYVNLTQSTKAVASRLIQNNTDIGSIGGNGVLNFYEGDRIWFACQSTDPQTLTFTIRNMTIH